VKNPLAGRYVGTTEEGYQVSFRITSAGRVVNFSATTLLSCPQPQPPPPPPGQPPQPPVPPTTLVATVNTPTAIRLIKPSVTYPKGKRFAYPGSGWAPGGSPPGEVIIVGKASKGFVRMDGFFWLRNVQGPGGQTCRTRYNNELGGVGIPSWDARKVGGNK
jgi:hypothetical protein